ncbi:hypothetical protein CMALT430_160178 [Carnobacterium maltaromaticum]|nr:hypothetical protein CMALT430_160178 [Carnobacterium maltaromaticum]
MARYNFEIKVKVRNVYTSLGVIYQRILELQLEESLTYQKKSIVSQMDTILES